MKTKKQYIYTYMSNSKSSIVNVIFEKCKPAKFSFHVWTSASQQTNIWRHANCYLDLIVHQSPGLFVSKLERAIMFESKNHMDHSRSDQRRGHQMPPVLGGSNLMEMYGIFDKCPFNSAFDGLVSYNGHCKAIAAMILISNDMFFGGIMWYSLSVGHLNSH